MLNQMVLPSSIESAHLNICAADKSRVSLDATIASGTVICCEQTLCGSQGPLAYLCISARGAALFPATLVFDFPAHCRLLQETPGLEAGAYAARDRAVQRLVAVLFPPQIALRAADRSGHTISVMAIKPDKASQELSR